MSSIESGSLLFLVSGKSLTNRPAIIDTKPENKSGKVSPNIFCKSNLILIKLNQIKLN